MVQEWSAKLGGLYRKTSGKSKPTMVCCKKKKMAMFVQEFDPRHACFLAAFLGKKTHNFGWSNMVERCGVLEVNHFGELGH